MNKINNIVHIVPAYPPNLGGMEQRVSELVSKLHTVHVPVEVITSDLGAKPGVAWEKGIKVTRLKKISFLKTPVSFKLFTKLLFVKADVFHIHLAQPFFPVLAAIVAKIRRKPYIVHIRAIVESDNFFGKIFVFIFKNIALRFVFSNADTIIVLTNTYTELLIKKYHINQDRIVVIPNATEFSVVPMPKSIDQKIHEPIKLLAVGRLDKQKNYYFLLRVLTELKKSGHSFSISILGNGSQEEELKEYATELGVSDMIHWKGRVDGRNLENEYEKADLFVHTALFEGFGTVFIEAMAKGLPICATRAFGSIDVVKEGYNGFLSEFDEVEFAKNVVKIIEDIELYKTLSANNLSTVLTYSWNNIIKDTITIYDLVKSK